MELREASAKYLLSKGPLYPPGYRQTELGVIPVDWDIVPLSKMIASLNAGVSVNSVDEKLGLYGHSESVLKTSCISNGYFYPEECKKIQPNEIGRAKLNPAKNSIIISRMNTPALVGECGYVEKDYPFLFLPDRLWQTTLKKQAETNVRWLAYLLSFGQFSKAIKDIATGTSGSMKNISKGALLNTQVLFPDETEQTAIANALSDVDSLVESLTRLIAKKRQIKQGAMQTLLNPYENGRLKEGWVVKKLGEISDILTGFPFPSASYCENGIRLLRGSNIKRGQTDWNYDIKKCWPNMTPDIRKYELREGDVVVAMDGSLVGRSFAQLQESDLPALLLQRVARIRVKSDAFDINYIKEWVCSDIFTAHCDSLKTVTAIPHISPSDIHKFVLNIPEDKDDQTQIAECLSDMEAEIASLETKLAKYQQIKQGMMQNLLTGRIRLVKSEAKVEAAP